MGKPISREIRCPDEGCRALNAKAIGGFLEIKSNYAGIYFKIPVDTRKDTVMQCRRCKRQQVIPGSVFEIEPL